MVEVAAAVLQRPDGAFLLAQRPPGKVYAGYWEFPGGKVEPGERSTAALTRELREELGIDVDCAYPWLTRVHRYAHATVKLRFFRVTRWRGEPQAREAQAFIWQRPDAEIASPMLPANFPVLASLALPVRYAITDAGTLGTAEMLRRLERELEAGLKLVQVREPRLSAPQYAAFAGEVISMVHRHGGRVLVKTPVAGADGLHLTSEQLRALDRRPAERLCAASCHTREDLERAMALGLDFAVLGPVREKAGAAGLGWVRFAELARDSTIPVYGIGGLSGADLEEAWRAGAHGVAMIRAAWR